MNLGFSPLTAGILDIEAGFRLASELALNFVEVAYEPAEVMPELRKPERIAELSTYTGIATTLHLPFLDLNLASMIPAARETSVKRMQAALDYGAAIGAQCGVLHTGLTPFYQPQALALSRNALEQSLAELEAHIPIAIENLALSEYDLVREPEGLKHWLKHTSWGMCLDFGHAMVERQQPWRDEVQHSEDLIQAYLEHCGDSIIHLHLHNNDGTADQHRATHEGSIGYHRYANFIRDFRGTICLEIAGDEAAVKASALHIKTLVEGLA